MQVYFHSLFLVLFTRGSNNSDHLCSRVLKTDNLNVWSNLALENTVSPSLKQCASLSFFKMLQHALLKLKLDSLIMLSAATCFQKNIGSVLGYYYLAKRVILWSIYVLTKHLLNECWSDILLSRILQISDLIHIFLIQVFIAHN